MYNRIFGEGWFTTPSEKKKSDEAYLKKMFPFGEKQRQWEDETIKAFFDPKRYKDIKYMCLIRREMYIDDRYNESDYKTILKNMSINEDEERFIELLTELELKAKNIEELPTIEEIKKSYYNL